MATHALPVEAPFEGKGAAMIKIPDGYATVMAGSESIRKELRKKDAEKGKSAAQTASDAVNISGRGHDVAHARSVALAAPEIRKALVDELMGAISRGAYHVPGEEVAPKMLREHAMEWTVEPK